MMRAISLIVVAFITSINGELSDNVRILRNVEGHAKVNLEIDFMLQLFGPGKVHVEGEFRSNLIQIATHFEGSLPIP
ncbi:hypothetical protein PRIPAC_71645 [Pristionchus pacificus]|uniref:Uncharacterized protein n=1 Tax=Pristionchus pacificus TaxID=54126 RepID=A0A454XPS8_PRIPA|nr:hypothetical protein PRIPAC_71645 [Pristionchus pacificus]|eukprot:PDM74460.1 hypothetical protein PRIPAC_41816 [Pristionchus pacificus]